MCSFPLTQGLSTRNPCRGLRELWSSSFHTKRSPKSSRPQPTSEKCPVEVRSIWAFPLLHPPCGSTVPISPSSTHPTQPWCQTHLAVEQLFLPCPDHRSPLSFPTVRYCTSSLTPSLFCFPLSTTRIQLPQVI